MTVTPEDFKLEVVPERPIGTEGESTLRNIDGAGRAIVVDDYISGKAIAAAGLRRVGKFVDYGDKVHVDCKKLEVATREALGPKAAAHEDFYGIPLLQSIVRASGLAHKGLYRVAGTFIPQESRDYDPRFGATTGFHHNYLLPRYAAADFTLLAEVLGAHLATRLWAMAGTVRPKGFVFSQKMWGIGSPVIKGYGDNRTKPGKKPMAAILLEDKDTVGDTSNWVRVEDRSPDPSLNIEVTELTLATTSLVLRLIEHVDKLKRAGKSGKERLLGAVCLRDPVAAGHTFAKDLTLKETVETANGEQVTAMDIQERLAKFARELSRKILLPSDEQQALDDWESRISAMRRSNPASADYVTAMEGTNFAPRHLFLLHSADPNKVIDPSQVKATNSLVTQRNLTWDRIEPEGFGLKHQRAVAKKRRREWPTAPTTPKTRGGLRHELMQDPEVTDAKWVSVSRGTNNIPLPDVFQTELNAA